MLETILHHPRKLWLRRALFQIHLWLGVLLAVYVVLISVSGSILVFQDEIRAASLPHTPFDPAHLAPINTVIAQAHSSFPASQLTFITPPLQPGPQWALFLTDPHGHSKTIYADAASGVLIQPHSKLFIDYVLDLHVYLLMGHTGFILNCIAGIGLLLLALTGAVLWWPGIKLWKRGFLVPIHHRWKRINYDAHSAIGIWTLLIVSFWGLTAVYFLFPTRVASMVNAVSPLIGMKEPQSPKQLPGTAVASLENILATQKTISPGYLSGIALPEKPGGNITLYVDLRSPGDFSHRDIDTFDGHTGKLLTIWHYGQNKSLGDWILWLVYPLHFGTLWGLPIKILWALLGLALAVLSMTGVLMYWNRYLHTRWRALCS